MRSPPDDRELQDAIDRHVDRTARIAARIPPHLRTILSDADANARDRTARLVLWHRNRASYHGRMMAHYQGRRLWDDAEAHKVSMDAHIETARLLESGFPWPDREIPGHFLDTPES